jgi:hypothetical protein
MGEGGTHFDFTVRFLCLLLLLIASLFRGVIFHLLFKVSLLVEVRLRASLSVPKRTPVANDALRSFLFFLRQQQNPNAVRSL